MYLFDSSETPVITSWGISTLLFGYEPVQGLNEAVIRNIEEESGQGNFLTPEEPLFKVDEYQTWS